MDTGDHRRAGLAELLVGRTWELDLIRSFLGQAAADGATLLLSGEPGVGKTVLLDAAGQAASAAGTRVLPAAGTEFEVDVGFAALNQLLLPLHEEFERLGAVHRDALSVALGFGDGQPAGRLTVATAAVALLRQAAAARPLLVVVDDLNWLDRSSAAVLSFVARRLTGSRVGLIAASRTGAETFFERGGLPELDVQPLDEGAATSLLSTHFPALAANVRRRVLAEAQGNPLALLELPAVLNDPQRTARRAWPAVLPGSRRLRTLFAPRIAELPASARRLLLLAALDGTGDLGVLQAAAGADTRLADLLPAESARLVGFAQDTGRLVFRHPLVRSTVVDFSTAGERRGAQRALAEALTDQPERRAWHLADATVGTDEQVAGLLEHTARRALRRGDGVGAVAALLRAADLSPRGADRSRRLAEAAFVGADVTGELRTVPQLLDDAREASLGLSGSLAAAVAAAYLLINGEGDLDTAHKLLVGAIETGAGGYDAEDRGLIDALHTLFIVCWVGGRPELWEPFHAAMARVTPEPPAVLSLCASTFADPARASASVLDELDTIIGRLHNEADPALIVWIGRAAFFVDRMSACRESHWRVVRDGREGGAVASAIGAMINLCLDDLLTGRWEEAQELATEGLALCEAHGYRLLQWPLWFGQAFLAAARGDEEVTRALTDAIIQWAAPRRAGTVRLYALHARAIAALGRGDVEDAYQHAAAISPPGVLAPYVSRALWAAMDLVEAAVRTDRRAEAAAHVTAMRDAGIAALSPRLALVVAGSAAMAAPAGSAGGLFEEALAVPGIERWPFDLARVHLAYGERLRRAHATAEARVELSAAYDTFRRLGARPWATRAGNELRAAGMSAAHADEPRPAAITPLTPQEHEIALLAATGLTNKQIGQRLHLSHRTVGAHLYRIFPKLGITSRAALRDSLPPQQPAGTTPGSG